MKKVFDSTVGHFRGPPEGDGENDSDVSEVLLSDIIVETDGYLTPEKLQEVLEYAKMCQSLGRERTDEQENWLSDFIQNIGRVVERDREMNAMIEARARREPLIQVGDRETSKKPLSQGTEPQPIASTSKTNEQIQNDSKKPRTKVPEPSWSVFGHDVSRFGAPGDRPLPLPPAPRASGYNQPPRNTPTIRLNELAHRPEKFDGRNEKAYRWLEDYEAAAKDNCWDEDVMVKYMSAFLEKSARDWHTAVLQPRMDDNTSWADVRRHFLRYYVGPEELDAIRDEIRRLRQGAEERATEFIARSLRLMRVGYPDQTERERVKELKLKLRHQYKDRLIGQRLATLEDLTDLCLEIEQHLTFSNSKSKQQNQTQKSDRVESSSKQDNKRSRRRQKDKTESKSGASDKQKPSPNANLQCTHCKKSGHTEAFCWSKHGKPERKAKKAAAVVEGTPKLNQVTTTIKNVCGATQPEDNDNYVLQAIKLNNKKFTAMLDSGSRMSFIRSDVARKLRLCPDGSAVDVVGANSKKLECEGKVTLNLSLTIGNKTKMVDCQFVVMPELCVDVLVGNALMALLKIAVDPGKCRAYFTREGKGLRLVEAVKLPPRSQSIVVVEAGVGVEPDDVVLTTTHNIGSSLMVANTVDKVDENGQLSCLIVNLEHSFLEIAANTQVAGVQHVEEQSEGVLSESLVSDERANATLQLGDSSEVVQVGDKLTEQQVNELRVLLNRHLAAFSISGRIGETSLIEHDIELLEGAQPVAEPLRRRPLAHRQECARQVEKMLADGIIEHSSSPWAAAYVVVKKKTGDARICIDFRRLNALTKKNKFPLPNIEDCLEPLSGNIIYSQLDLASGYWQIQVAKKAREMTAFRTETGHYQFCRMPFGLTNAPASFQRLVNALFSGLAGVHLQVFIDDVCLASRTWPEHLQLIDQVLTILERANLTLKASKCVFGAERVVFLGHQLSREGIRQDPAKVKAIAKLEIPKNAHEVQRVMGLFNYYRRFIANFALISEPLTRLTRKSVNFEWGKEQNESFETLKKQLTADILLSHFNHTDPLTLKTDASRTGVAGILLQRQENEWRMITAVSRRLTSAEERYGITDLEGLAIVYSVTKLRNYLLGKHFTILTDHCPLCSIKKRVPTSARLYRWTLLLDEYDFSIQYIRGGLHSDVDCLSRAPVDDVDDALSEKVLASCNQRQVVSRQQATPCLIVVPQDVASWRDATMKDAEGAKQLEIARKRTKGYKIFQGCLYFEERLFVPANKREAVMKENHCDQIAGHGGMRATAERMACYWWPSMADDIRAFVAACPICQARKAQRVRPSGRMSSFDIHEPFELMAFDALGPLPPSLSGKRHVFVGIDVFTRFVVAEAVEDVRADTFVDFFRRLIAILGFPRQMLSDNATTFCNNVVASLAKQYDIELRSSTAGHHEGNASVERCIQTLQEKIALITHDPASSPNWEEELPLAVLSINTTVHATTGFTPFELLFGKKHCCRSSEVVARTDAVARYAEQRDVITSAAQAIAVARQADVQWRSKQRFDAQHRHEEFKEGDKVLAKLLGRRTKLQNRYAGPYRVTAKKGDIYKLESCDTRRDKLERHVSDLRQFREIVTVIISSPVNNRQTISRQIKVTHQEERASQARAQQEPMRYYAVCLLLIVPVVAFEEFREAPLVTWVPTQTYSSPGEITFRLLAKFGHPCHVLSQFQLAGPHPAGRPNTVMAHQQQRGTPEEVDGLVQLCVATVRTTIMSPLNRLLASPIRAHALLPPAPHGALPPVPHAQEAGAGGRPGHYDLVGPNHNLIARRRDKRGLGDFFLGTFACDVLETVVDEITHTASNKDLAEREHNLEFQLGKLSANHNFTALQINALKDASAITAQLVQHNIQEIGLIRSKYPQLTIVASDIIARTHLLGSHIERLLASFKMGKPDIQSLYSIFKVDKLLEVDADSILEASVSLSAPFQQSIMVEFTARQRSPDTRVYQVMAFNYYRTDGEGKRSLLEYVGPNYVLYNSHANCVMGINQPTRSYVTAQCIKKDYKETRLSNWREIHAPHPEETKIIEAYPKVRVSCYPQLIVSNSKQKKCPLFPIELDASEAWKTLRRTDLQLTYDYSPAAVEYHTIVNSAELQRVIDSVHLAANEGIPSKETALARVEELLHRVQQLESNTTLISIGQSPVLYKHTTAGLSMSTMGLLLGLVYLLYHRARNYVHRLEVQAMIEEEQRRYVWRRLKAQRRSWRDQYGTASTARQAESPNLPMLGWRDDSPV